MARDPDSFLRRILVCYDGSPGAARAVEAAGVLFPGRAALVLYVSSRVAVGRVRTTSVTAVREELVEEVRVAARREAAAIADEGAARARDAGLDATPLVIEAGDGPADAIVRVAIKESAAAVVVGRPRRTRHALRSGGLLRRVVEQCPLPILII